MTASSQSGRRRGTVSLIALCFVAVLGIVLASYIAVCSRAMNLSNRNFHVNLSRQLAEFGVEDALRAFNKADWSNWSSSPTGVSATAWSLDTTNKRATRTITYASGKLGQGVTATIKIRVDNYDVAILGAGYSSTASYRAGNIVGQTDGNWYRSIAHNSGKTPATTGSTTMYWIQEHNMVSSALTWVPGASYSSGQMSNLGGTWYRYTNASTTTATSANSPPNVPYWTEVPFVSADADLHYNNEAILNYYTTWYRYNSGWEDTPNVNWRWRGSTSYAVGDIINQNNLWYRARVAHTSGGSFSATNWDTAATLTAAAGNNWALWASGNSYSIGDTAYDSSRWYRAIKANSGQTPSGSSSYWSAYPLYPVDWERGRQYNRYDVVRFNGTWYFCKVDGTLGQPPSTGWPYWASPRTTDASYDASYAWNATTTYATNAYRFYGGIWYKSTTPSTNIPPTNTSFWTSNWANSFGATAGGPVIYSEASVSIAGSTPATLQLRATIGPAPLFPNAVAATTALSLNTGTIDSYNSLTDPNALDTTSTTSATVASSGTLTITGALAVKGYLAWPSPPAGINGTMTLNGNQYSTNKTRVSRSPFIPNFAIHTVPGGAQATSSTTTLGVAGSATPAVYYYNSGGVTNLTLSTSTLTVAGPTILYVQGNLRIYNNTSARIRILPTGSLRLVVGRDFRVESDGGGIENQTQDPSKCTVLCLRSGSDTFDFSVPGTTNKFYGTIYIPNSSSTLTLGTGVEIFGAVSAQSITASGSVTVHYDNTLRSKATDGVDQPYGVTDWRELPAGERASL